MMQQAHQNHQIPLFDGQIIIVHFIIQTIYRIHRKHRMMLEELLF